MNKEDVFVKPDEQNKACSGSAMERKDFYKMEQFFLHSNEVNHINREDYEKIELLVNAAKAFPAAPTSASISSTIFIRTLSMHQITSLISADWNRSS